MSRKQSGELKKRAWLAKQRLKMGYWDSVRSDEVTLANGTEVKPTRVPINSAVSVSKRDLSDERMYERVCEMLDRDEATLNPIGQLIDGEVYNKLDATARQRYILELSNKFRELKERYYRERTGA